MVDQTQRFKFGKLNCLGILKEILYVKGWRSKFYQDTDRSRFL